MCLRKRTSENLQAWNILKRFSLFLSMSQLKENLWRNARQIFVDWFAYIVQLLLTDLLILCSFYQKQVLTFANGYKNNGRNHWSFFIGKFNLRTILSSRNWWTKLHICILRKSKQSLSNLLAAVFLLCHCVIFFTYFSVSIFFMHGQFCISLHCGKNASVLKCKILRISLKEEALAKFYFIIIVLKIYTWFFIEQVFLNVKPLHSWICCYKLNRVIKSICTVVLL